MAQRVRGHIRGKAVESAPDERREGPDCVRRANITPDHHEGGHRGAGETEGFGHVVGEDAAQGQRQRRQGDAQQRCRGVPHEVDALGRIQIGGEQKIVPVGEREPLPAQEPDRQLRVSADAERRRKRSARREPDGREESHRHRKIKKTDAGKDDPSRDRSRPAPVPVELADGFGDRVSKSGHQTGWVTALVAMVLRALAARMWAIWRDRTPQKRPR